jgi:multiple sugar transport system permease protein
MRWVGGDNFARLLTDATFRVAFRNTLVFVFFAVTGEFLLGLGLALVAVRRLSRAEGLFRSLILLPMIVTPVVVGMMWRLLYNHELGMINYFLSLVGLPGQSWLTDLRLVMPVVILTDIWQWMPFMFLMLLAGLSSIPTEPLEAARVDGANAWQTFRHVTWPLLTPIVLVAVMIRAIDAVKVFDLVYIMTFGGPGNATETLSLYAYRMGFIRSDIGYGAAISLVLTVVVTVLSMVAVRRLSRQVDY